MEQGDVASIRDIVYHRVEILNANENIDYLVLGQVVFDRKINKQTEATTIETTNIIYPIEFWIFDEGKEIGQLTINKRIKLFTSALYIDIIIHDKLLNFEFKEQLNKRKVSVVYNDQQIAFFELKPASFISTSQKGNVQVKAGITPEFTNDIFTSYILADIVWNSLTP